MKIGVFDSGLGGLSIFKAIKAELPEYDYLYLGDSARAPYGNHSHELIYQYTVQAVEFLFKHDCALVILACNTASAQALRRLQQEWLPSHEPDRRVLGVIRPIAEAVAAVGVGKKIGVIGTRATITSGAYTKEIQAQPLSDKANVLEQACPLLVPLIEEGFHKRAETKSILRYYLRPLKQANVDVLVSGCTHYELLAKTIGAMMGKRVKLINSPQVVAASLADYFKRHPEMDKRLSRDGSVQFLTTDKDNRFDRLASMFYGPGVKAEVVCL
ncbi:MAG: glutamate racemase [Parcubacteria group bacterium]|nr:glutamate racemase [Parcubacteria group bacterium]